MAASYPSSVKSFTTKVAGDTVASAHIDDLQDETVAVEAALLNGLTHALKPTVSGAQDLGTASLFWNTLRARALQLDAVTTLTIAAGVVTATRSHHALDTESAAATDDLDTITATGLTDGFLLILRPANVSHVVTLKDGTGNLLLDGDCALNATDRTLTLLWDGTHWREIARSVANETPMRLLASGSGTDTNASAANVATVAISGLTVFDTLRVVATLESATQLTSTPALYNNTDGVTIGQMAGNVTTGQTVIWECGATAVSSKKIANVLLDAAIVKTLSTFTTDWTGSWTLALRHNGVTSGGTFAYRWRVYQIAGQ